MFVTRRTAAEKFQRFLAGVPQLVLLARQYGNSIPGLHLGHFSFNAHSALAGEDEINLLRAGVIMLLRARPWRQPRLGQALIANGRVTVRQQFPNFRPVFGNERWRASQVLYFHRGRSCWTKRVPLERKKHIRRLWYSEWVVGPRPFGF